jgi:hypothetical protein
MVAFPVDPVLVLFLVYVTIHELSLLFGDGELYRLFFGLRSSEAKLTRRRRIRLLVCLNRLTEANSTVHSGFLRKITQNSDPGILGGYCRGLPFWVRSAKVRKWLCLNV